MGPFGPTLANCAAAYSSTAWAAVPGVYSFGAPAGASMAAWQVLKLPHAGTYTITAAGASNGVLAPASSLNGGVPCRGAVVSTTLAMPYNTSLYVIVGQAGTCDGASRACSSTSFRAGGGGGTFVLLANSSALLVAGGGGGWYWPPPGSWAQCNAQLSNNSGGGGHGANGDTVGGVAGSAGGGSVYGGAGLLADATSPGDTSNAPPKSALNGGAGSYYAADWTQGDRNGGFGGGGFSGGGGGYSGGGGGVSVSSWISGGGGSFCLGSCVANSFNLGDGYVTITPVVSLPFLPPATSASNAVTPLPPPLQANSYAPPFLPPPTSASNVSNLSSPSSSVNTLSAGVIAGIALGIVGGLASLSLVVKCCSNDTAVNTNSITIGSRNVVNNVNHYHFSDPRLNS